MADARSVRPFFLDGNGLHVLDQRALPDEEIWTLHTEVETVATCIENLAVRGAPAIGGVAAQALAISTRKWKGKTLEQAREELAQSDARLRKTRPTAVNLFNALDAVKEAAHPAKNLEDLTSNVCARAHAWVAADADACNKIGNFGSDMLVDGDVVITICHTGALATCGQGTALGVVKTARRLKQRDVRVVALETRPLLQGARLTAWECQRDEIPCTLVTDGMAAFALERLGVTKAIVGADRIAKDGSVANKIGTLGLALVCKALGVPFYVAAPTTTIDSMLTTGHDIPIEERNAEEVRRVRGLLVSPAEVAVWNPAFDITPGELLDGIITEKGILKPPYSLG